MRERPFDSMAKSTFSHNTWRQVSKKENCQVEKEITGTDGNNISPCIEELSSAICFQPLNFSE
jgi:hypothetical protein